MVTLPKVTYGFRAIPIRITTVFIAEMNKLILNFIWKYLQGARTAKMILKKKYPITIKPETVSHVAKQVSWVLLPSFLHWCPFPTKSLALSAYVSPWRIHFPVLDESILRPWKGFPFLKYHCNYYMQS